MLNGCPYSLRIWDEKRNQINAHKQSISWLVHHFVSSRFDGVIIHTFWTVHFRIVLYVCNFCRAWMFFSLFVSFHLFSVFCFVRLPYQVNFYYSHLLLLRVSLSCDMLYEERRDTHAFVMQSNEQTAMSLNDSYKNCG